MGKAISLPLPPLPSNHYMTISIASGSVLALLHAGHEELCAVRNAIVSTYPKGIKSENYELEAEKGNPKNRTCYQFTLNGLVFFSKREDLLQSSLIFSAIFIALEKLGWKPVISSQLTKSKYTHGTFIFQRQFSTTRPSSIFSLGLLHFDILQLNNCPEHVVDAIKEICQQKWAKGIQKQETFENAYWIKLKGSPWNDYKKNESCQVRRMFKEIFQKLSSMQYQFYGNGDLIGGTDAIFFKQNLDLQAEEYLCVSLNQFDRIRLVDVPEHICSAIRETVARHWVKGIKEQVTDEDCYELRLSGKPWLAMDKEAAESRLLMCRIFETLACHGYFIISGLDVGGNDSDKSLLLFKQGGALTTSFMCLSLNRYSEIKFINAPENITEAGQSIIRNSPLGVQSEKPPYDGVTYEALLKNSPWNYLHEDGLHGLHILLNLLVQFQSMGWRLVCSADVSAQYDDDEPTDVHSWWFMYDPTLL